jgi:hypothetical protein
MRSKAARRRTRIQCERHGCFIVRLLQHAGFALGGGQVTQVGAPQWQFKYRFDNLQRFPLRMRQSGCAALVAKHYRLQAMRQCLGIQFSRSSAAGML